MNKMPLAFVVMPFAVEHDQLYNEAIKTSLTEEGFSITRADEISNGGAFIGNIFGGIEQSSLVIGVISGKNPNVMYELGYAERLGKPSILMIDKAAEIPSDIRHINHLIYTSVEDAREKLILWLKNTEISGRFRKNSLLTRGEVLDHIIDSAFYLQRSRPVPSKQEITEAFRQRKHLRQHILYITEEGLSSYLELCADPEYDYYIETSRIITRNKKEIVNSVLQNSKSQEIDFISLGPGNGQKDAVLLDEFCKNARENAFVYYYPYDISGGMLLEATRTVINKKLPISKFKLKAIEADFQQLATFLAVFDYRSEPNVFSLLGGLSYIGGEVAILKLIRSVMGTRDTFLLEVRKANSMGIPAAMGQRELNIQLDVSALRYIGAIFDSAQIEYVESERPSDIPETITFVARLPEVSVGNETFRNVELFQIDYYEPKQLIKKVKSMGFSLLQKYETENSLLVILGKDSSVKIGDA